MNASRRRTTPELPPPPPAAPAPYVPVQLHTVEAAAERLSISPRMLRKQIALGRVRVVRIGRGQRISEAELQRISVEGTA